MPRCYALPGMPHALPASVCVSVRACARAWPSLPSLPPYGSWNAVLVPPAVPPAPAGLPDGWLPARLQCGQSRLAALGRDVPSRCEQHYQLDPASRPSQLVAPWRCTLSLHPVVTPSEGCCSLVQVACQGAGAKAPCVAPRMQRMHGLPSGLEASIAHWSPAAQGGMGLASLARLGHGSARHTLPWPCRGSDRNDHIPYGISTLPASPLLA